MNTWTSIPTTKQTFGASPRRTILGALAGALVLACILAPPARAAEDDEDRADLGVSGYDDNGDPSESARVRFLEGDVKIERDGDDRVDEGSLNAPVFPGDVVTTAHGRVEVQLADGTLVRMDETSRVTFLSLPEPGGNDEDTVLQVSEGSASVEVRGALSRDKDFRIDTPSASVYLLASGRYRIDVEGRYKKTRTSAFRGVAEVVGDDGSVILRSGQRTFVGDSGEPEPARTFNTAASDEFDGWVLDRSDHYRRASADDDVGEDALPEPVRPYRSELSYYGSWVDVAPYGRCWVPGGVSAGWRPYGNGYWAYGPGGNFWVSYDPWGWAPYHYGRWVFVGGRGWFWVPGDMFSGAWVSWFYGPSYFGWCPLDYWNNPCALRLGYVGFDFNCWNFVGYRNIFHRNVRRVIVTPTVVRADLGRGVVTRRAVPIRPRDIRDNRIAPPLILQKARDMKSQHVDIQGERVAKRSFRESEKEVARRAPGMRRLSPGESRRPTQDARPPSGRKEAPGPARDRGARGPDRERSTTRERGTEAGRPRMHGPDSGKSRDDDRGKSRDDDRGRDKSGSGRKPSQRSLSSDDQLPSRPRVASDGSAHPGWERPRPVRPDGARSRTLNDDGADTLRPEVPRRLRGPGGTSDDDPANGWAPAEIFRESDRQRALSAQERPRVREYREEASAAPRASDAPRARESRSSSPPAPRASQPRSSEPRGRESRSAPREVRTAPPPPPPAHQREEKKKK